MRRVTRDAARDSESSQVSLRKSLFVRLVKGRVGFKGWGMKEADERLMRQHVAISVELNKETDCDDRLAWRQSQLMWDVMVLRPDNTLYDDFS